MTQPNLFGQDPKANLQAFGGWVARTATLGNLVAVTWLGLSILIGTLVVQDLTSDAVTIEPIEVPKTLSDTGYSPGVAGHRLHDALNAYVKTEDSSTAPISNLSLFAYDSGLPSNLDLKIAAPAPDKVPDVMVPQIGLSLRTIVSSIRSASRRTGHTISGELTVQDKKYSLRLRIDGQQIFTSKYEAEDPDYLMAKAAPDIMEIIRPAAYAMAQYRVRKEQGLLKASQIIARYDKSDINVQWAYLLKGKHALEQGHYKEAEEMFSSARRLNWNSEEPHIQLGIMLLRQAKPKDAIYHFKRVVAINPKSAKAYNYIGVALTLENQDNAKNDPTKLDAAIEQYQRAIDTKPDYALAYNNIGLALLHRKNISRAIEKYRSAIEIAPDYLLARWNLAFALQELGSFDAAATEYRGAIKVAEDPEKVEQNPRKLAMLYTFLGDVLRANAGANGNLDEAVRQYRHAIEIVSPDCYGWAHNNLGRIRYDQSKMNEAIVQFDKVATCEPNEPIFRDNLKQALRAQDAGATTTSQANR